MIKRSGDLARKPSYVVTAFMWRHEAAWMIYESRTGRLVAKLSDRDTAYTLAHTMNVADLAVPVRDYGGDP